MSLASFACSAHPPGSTAWSRKKPSRDVQCMASLLYRQTPTRTVEDQTSFWFQLSSQFLLVCVSAHPVHARRCASSPSSNAPVFVCPGSPSGLLLLLRLLPHRCSDDSWCYGDVYVLCSHTYRPASQWVCLSVTNCEETRPHHEPPVSRSTSICQNSINTCSNMLLPGKHRSYISNMYCQAVHNASECIPLTLAASPIN